MKKLGRKNRRKDWPTRPLPRVTEVKSPARMDIWLARLPSHKGNSVQGGTRPVLVVSNNAANVYSPVVTILPMTTKMKHLMQPTHVVLPDAGGRDSLVLAEQITSIPKRWLIQHLGRCEDSGEQKQIEDAMRMQIGLEGNGNEPNHL